MYNLTVSAGFADSDTFLNSIPLYYDCNSASTSVFDEILDCRIPNINTYVQLIEHVNAPGPKCWGFGSVDIVLASIEAANDAVSPFVLQNLDTTDASGIVGNSLFSLWKLFNADNDLPDHYISASNTTQTSNVTLDNVAKSVNNFIKLHKFCNNGKAPGSQVWGAGTEMRTYNNLVTNAKIPVEVLLCVYPSAVTRTNINTCLSMNNVWNF